MRWVFAWCAAPTGVRLAAITAGESESLSESESENESEDVCVHQELRQKVLKRTRDDGERACAPAAGASGLMEMESLTQDHPG